MAFMFFIFEVICHLQMLYSNLLRKLRRLRNRFGFNLRIHGIRWGTLNKSEWKKCTYIDVMTRFWELFIIFSANSVFNLLYISFLRYSIINWSTHCLLLCRILKLNSANTSTPRMQSSIFCRAWAALQIAITKVWSKHILLLICQWIMNWLCVSSCHCLIFEGISDGRLVFPYLARRLWRRLWRLR